MLLIVFIVDFHCLYSWFSCFILFYLSSCLSSYLSSYLSSCLSSWARQEHWLPRNIVGIVVNYISVFPCPSVFIRGWYTSHWETSFRGYGFDHWLHWPSLNQGYISCFRAHPCSSVVGTPPPTRPVSFDIFPIHTRYIPDTYPIHTYIPWIPHEYPANTPTIGKKAFAYTLRLPLQMSVKSRKA